MGLVLFPDDPTMRLGMFFTGVAPGGGASNIWTAILEGNIDLSILMTTVSTLSAFGMMPLWLFTLGATIFDDADIEVSPRIHCYQQQTIMIFQVPYSHISTYVVALIIPLGIGYLIQRYFKKLGLFLKRILKGFSSLLILFIIVFAIVTNLYLFELFSWRVSTNMRKKPNSSKSHYLLDCCSWYGNSVDGLYSRLYCSKDLETAKS